MKLINDIYEITSDEIYLYGAGRVAELLIKEIKEYSSLKIRAVVVSERPVELEPALNGITIIPIEEGDNRIPVLVATFSDSHEEIASILQKHNYDNVMLASETMFEKIRKHFVPDRHDKAAVKIKINELKKLACCKEAIPVAITSLKDLSGGVRTIYTQEEFIACNDRMEEVFVFDIDWGADWIGLLSHVMANTDAFNIAYRFKFLDDKRFLLIQEAKAAGFQLTKLKRIDRDRRDYCVEDVILRFERNGVGRERGDYVCIGCAECRDACPVKEMGMKPNGFSGMYDVGLVGNWSYPNYGSELTYYALYSALKKMGKSVLMIEWAEDCRWKPYGVTQLFEEEPYDCREIAMPIRNHSEFYALNAMCHSFVQGSDQLLHPYLYDVFGHNVILDWVNPDKKKIAYAVSFGHEKVAYRETDVKNISFQLSMFDAVSVREKSAVKLMDDMFGRNAVQVLDPVFLQNQDFYAGIAGKYLCKERTVFSYILDPPEEVVDMMNQYAEALDCKLRIVLDAAQKRRTSGGLLENVDFSVEKWVASIINSRFVITDSFHGMCIAIICNKDFIAICNDNRGATRFESILQILGLEERMVKDVNDMRDMDRFLSPINFDEVNKIICREKEKSFGWLKDALEMQHTKKVSTEFEYLQNCYRELETRFYGE